jgi:hypothetical protein
MLSEYGPWLFIDAPVEDDGADLLTIPEIRRELAHTTLGGDGLGLRSLLEHPEVLSRALRSQGSAGDVRRKRRRSVHHVPRAA